MNPRRQRSSSRRRPFGSTLALIAIAWIALIAPPCVMGLTLEQAPAAEHQDCPHCPPQGPSGHAAREDCASVDGTAVLPDKPVQPLVLAVAAFAGHATDPSAEADRPAGPALPQPPPRPGPRPHLRHGQFNE